MTMAAGFEKVFQIGPVFRATHSYTTRHDTEFTQYDIEVSFVGYKEIMELEEKLVKYILARIKEKHDKEIKKHFGIKIKIPFLPFPRIKLEEAKKLLESEKIKARKEGDLSPEEEKKLYEIIKEKTGSEFVFVTHYPYVKRAFYHMKGKDKKTACKRGYIFTASCK